MVEGDGLLHDCDEGLATLSLGLVLATGVVTHGNARPRGQAVDGLDEVARLDRAKERDRISGGLATEAVIDAELGVHRERTCLLGMEGAKPHIARPDAL